MDTLGSRVLIVDGEDAVRAMLADGLAQTGFSVLAVPNGREMLDAIPHWCPEAIVLDVTLPDTDGFTLLPPARRLTDAPIIILSAQTESAQKVAALENGADDYVGKPFAIEELIARLNSALRRPRLELRELEQYADVGVDVGRRLVYRGRRAIELSTREFDLLLTFVRNPGVVFTRNMLLDLVWGADRDVLPNTVETYISYLRAKIDSNERLKLIHTLRGAGYVMRTSAPLTGPG
jgi:DNA-binding response OmpR family regulator